MFKNNVEISQSVLNACIKANTKPSRVCSNCAYPKAKQPYKEEDIIMGNSYTNQSSSSEKFCRPIAANKEYGIDVYHPIPCSLFGYRDNYNENRSHLVAAAIKKIDRSIEIIKKKLSLGEWKTM